MRGTSSPLTMVASAFSPRRSDGWSRTLVVARQPLNACEAAVETNQILEAILDELSNRIYRALAEIHSLVRNSGRYAFHALNLRPRSGPLAAAALPRARLPRRTLASAALTRARALAAAAATATFARASALPAR